MGRRCARCMKELENEDVYCPDCGHDQRQGNSERALPVGTVLNGKYLIGAVIGEGGFGVTYAAWDTLIETRIAIKEYFPSELVTRNTTLMGKKEANHLTLIQENAGEGRYRSGLERFVQEAGNLAKFQRYPGVVSVKDFFYENNTAYMVMEYIDGVTLNSYLENNGGRLEKEEAFRMMEPVMKTLEAIHKEGVIHRDISPDNIMVTAGGQMKLIDFGAARFVGADDEKSLTVILKQGYAPEEQYRSNGEQGAWTDVYALSAVIYRMLTGKVPEETLKRMARKQDGIHVELKTVPGLSAAERMSLEKGLAVRAEKRYRTIGTLYDGIYGKKRQDIWKWIVGVGLASTLMLCIFIVEIVINNKDVSETLVTADNDWKEENESGLTRREETGKEDTESEKIEIPKAVEPESIRTLREYYNTNGMWEIGRACFVDMTGDGEDEMIVAEKSKWYDDNSIFDVVVYQYKNKNVEEIYRSDGRDWIYCLGSEDGNAYILRRYKKTTDSGWDSKSEYYYEKVSLMDMKDESLGDIGASDEEMDELFQKGVLLKKSNRGILFDESEALPDYESVLEHKEMLEEAMEIAENSMETVLDYTAVYDGDDRCIFVVTEKMREGIYSVWAVHDGQMEEVEAFQPNEEFDLGYDGQLESKIYQFGKAQHYILELNGTEQWRQHKFCYEDGTARKTDDSRYFEKDKNGKVKMLIAGYPNRAHEFGSDSGVSLNMTTLIDVFYYDHQYVEYGAEKADISDLEQYENYREILQEAEENLLQVSGAEGGHENISYESVEKAKFVYMRKAVNGTYYLNYKIYVKMDEGNNSVYGNASEVTKEPDADGNYENIFWAYVVLEAAGNRLEIENLYRGEKKEESGSGLPLYYGADRELKLAGSSRDELKTLIVEKSGSWPVLESYEDFDGDGKSEMFAYVENAQWSLDGCAIVENDREYALWFSDGEQTVQVTELAEGYDGFSMDALLFGKNLQCSLTRLKPNKYLSIDEVLSMDGYATTVCTLENGSPRIIIQDENIRFYQKEDSVEEIGCYAGSGEGRSDDAVFYRDGKYYWKSDSTPVLD